MTVSIRVPLLSTALFLIAAGSVNAQGPGTGGYGPGLEDLMQGRGGAGYLPLGRGGFLPYAPGPGGGLGVQSRMTARSTSSSTVGTTGMPGVGGEARGLSPISPIRGMGSGLLPNRGPAGRGMGRSPARLPVGSYPFRVPPSLLGPASGAPTTSM